MAIENLEQGNPVAQEDQTLALTPVANVFQASNVWLAGTLKLRCPSMEESLILYGFIGKCDELNIDDYKVDGMTIAFAAEDFGYRNRRKEYQIYTKVIADFKQNCFDDLFPKLNKLDLTSPIWENVRTISTISDDKKVNYYFFESNNHPNPSAASNEIYIVCKYKKNKKTKYALFAPHEVIIEQ